ncbi:hypothetical protein [Neorhodopirellula lusitana]|uniref:hypothetical protein n=1 Tax=Neorhodopirellula lusitana TaxID=445327 RepID=UPI00384B29C3
MSYHSWIFRKRYGLTPCIVAVLLVLGHSLTASADYVISIGSPGGVNVNLGTAGTNQSIHFYLGEDVGGGTAQPLAAALASFSLEAGVVEGAITTGGIETSMNETGTVSAEGSPGTPGYFGAGNLFQSTIEKVAESSFQINQVFSDLMQPVQDFSAPERWFTVNLDTTGLAEGTYAITLDSPNNSFRNSSGEFVASASNLSFTVSAVPEPSSVATLMCLGCAGGFVRRFRRRRS